MKNSKLVKVVMGAIISLIVVAMANQVFADNVTDLTNALGNLILTLKKMVSRQLKIQQITTEKIM